MDQVMLFDDDEDLLFEEDDISGNVHSGDSINITTIDWTIETIVSQLLKGNIDLNPDFQRRNAWPVDKRNRFIESLVIGLPIPQLVLATDNRRSGKFIVIDGKQRLLTLLAFCSPNGFKLSGLPILRDLNGVTYKELTGDPQYQKYNTSFENNTIRTTQIKGWKNEGFLYLTFLRLNTGSVPLSSQELRQALMPGQFTRWVNDITLEDNITRKILRSERADFRMRDVELIIRFFAYKMFLDNYSGNLKDFLDRTCDYFNKNFELSRLNLLLDSMSKSVEVVFAVFGDDAFKKYKNGRYEASFNKAVFDVMLYYFSSPKVSVDLDTRTKAAVKAAFETLCTEDEAFMESLETTTKSIGAVSKRFRAWHEVLVSLGFDLQYLENLG